MRRIGLPWLLVTALACALGHGITAARSEPAAAPEADALETVVVVGVTPVLGTGIPIEQVPSNVQTLTADTIGEDHAETVTDVMDRHLASVTLTDTEGNPFQEDLVERGFTASPVLGTPQGLAIYQNGVRINEAFGDVVLWDLIPVFAIKTLQELPGSNPVFGLNALGGAVTLEMKNGYDDKGTIAEIAGGSFGRVRAIAQTGLDLGEGAIYLGAMASHEDGWRQLSPQDVVQGFGDYAFRGDGFTLGASLTLALSNLNGNGADPAEDDRTAAFAVPDTERNRLVFLALRGTDAITDTLSIQGTAYLRYANLRNFNGAASGFTPCGNTLCDDSGPLTTLGGAPLPQNLPFQGDVPVTTTQTLGLGGAVQATLDMPVGDLKNTANLGISFDQGSTHFREVNWLGDLVYLNPPGTTSASEGVQIGGDDYNIRLDAVNRYYGAFYTDTLSLTDALSLTVAGRFNFAEVRLSDRFGDELNGNHYYGRFNPSAGLTWQADPDVNLYASYSEANRIPTAAELGCSDPNQPCRFPLGFVSDPNLDQVVARTVELGARGHAPAGGDLTLDWSADVYGTRNQNDIIFVAAGPLVGSGFFQNAGTTQRLGAEATLDGKWRQVDFHANYGFVRATFRSNLTVFSDSNPASDDNGFIYVHPGDRLPEVPLHTARLGIGYSLPWGVHVGLDAVLVSSQYLRGDEANLQAPLPGYGVLNARASWQATDRLSFFLEGENILDTRYDSFGLYSDPTGNGAFPNFSNPRFYTPGQPFGVWVGAQLRL
ncbi:MAG TPA: TonB-dependent receptor [Stellaceae bacterium]|nr:TonB-dependent receptor [Stellaceae bacterium]